MTGRRIVLLEMAAEDADTLVRSISESGEVFHWGNGDAGLVASVAAVVARPTTWCQCNVEAPGGSRRRGKRESGWSRGTTFGWWLCMHCRKPSRAMVTHFVTTMLAGANDLLPKILGGKPQTPSERWEAEGGIPNPHANAAPAMPYASTGTSRRAQRLASGAVTRKVRPRRAPR